MKRNNLRRAVAVSAAVAGVVTGLGGPARATITLSGGTTDQTGAAASGLNAGKIFSSNYDKTNPNPYNAVVSGAYSQLKAGTVEAEDTTNNNGTANNLTGWNDNSTWVYTGQIYVPDNATTTTGNTATNDGFGQLTFVKNFDDSTLIKIDGTTVIDNGTYNATTLARTGVLTVGYHNIEVRLGQGTGGVGAYNQNGYTGIGLGIDPSARESTGPGTPADYVTVRNGNVDNTFTVQLQAFQPLTISDTVNVASSSTLTTSSPQVTTNGLTLGATGLTLTYQGGSFRYGSTDLTAGGASGTAFTVTTGAVAAGSYLQDFAPGQIVANAGTTFNKTGPGALVLDNTASANNAITFNVTGGNVVLVSSSTAANSPTGGSTIALGTGAGNLILSSTSGTATFDTPVNVNASNTILARQIGFSGTTVSGGTGTAGYFTGFNTNTAPSLTAVLGSTTNGVAIASGQTATLNTADGYTLEVDGAVTGAGNLTSIGTVLLGPTGGSGASNSYTGNTTVSAGALTINNPITGTTGTFTLSGGTVNANAGVTAASLAGSNGATFNANVAGSAAFGAAGSTVNTGVILFNYNAAGAVSGRTLSASAALAQVNLSSGLAGFGSDKFNVAANAILAVPNATVGGLLNRASSGGNLTAATGAVIAEQSAGGNNAVQNLGTSADVFFGLAADVSDSVTVGGTSPWRGLSNDRATRNLTGGTITAAGNFALQGLNAGTLNLGGVTITPTDAVTGSVVQGRIVLNSATPVYNNKLTFAAASGGAIQFNANTSMGTGATGAANAQAVAYNLGTLDPGPAGSISGNIFLETGSILQFNDANNLGGVGAISAEPGAVIDYSGKTTQTANGSTTQNLSGLPAGVLHRIGITGVVGLGTGAVTGTNPAGNYEVTGGFSQTINLSAGTPPRAGFPSGLLTQNNAAQTIGGSLVIGPGGGTVAASTGGTLTLSAPITVSGTSASSLTFGSNLIVDPTINSATRSGTVSLTGANVYDNGSGGSITQVNVRARATVAGTPSGAGNLPQGTGVGLNLGGIYQITGPAAGATLQLGAVTANGGILFLNRNATPTAGLVVNLNAPISRSNAFGPESRGTLSVQLLSGQALGTSTDKVTFSSAANAPSRITVNGTGGNPQINMLPPWLVGTDTAANSGNTTFLDAPDATGAGLIPVTYVTAPATGGNGTEIADATAALALTGDVTVAALRTNSNISGAFTINLTSGGLLFRGSTGASTISSNINFGANEGVIGNVNSGQTNTVSGKVSGTGGLTKFGGNPLVLSNSANDFTGGVTIDEANLRPGVASTATASPFGYTAAAGFNVVTVNTAGVLDLNGLATRIGGLQGAGLVNNQSGTAATLTLDVSTGNSLTFSGTIGASGSGTTVGTGAFSLSKTGSGSQILSGTLNYTGNTTITGGLLRVDGYSTAASAYSVATGATLGGSGIITGAVSIASGGNLSPGASPGLLRTGNLTISSSGNYLVDLNGPTVGSGYDQTEVIGSVTITGANLVPTLNYSPSAGDKLYIINNDGFDPITGTFASLPQGATINLTSTADGQTYPFTISYNGEYFGSGTTLGNDVVLIAQTPEPAAISLLGLASIGLLARRRRIAR